MKIEIPQLCLVVLVGPSGSGKSSFARQHFLPTEVLSSDTCRGWVSDDENNQHASHDAFEVLHFIARKRLAAGRLTVIDATNVRPEDRQHYVAMAREHDVLPVAIVLKPREELCLQRNRQRPDRQFGPHVVRQQMQALRKHLRNLSREGFRHVTVLDSEEQINTVQIERVRVWNDKRDEHGPFDIVGDVHGCLDELHALLHALGYQVGGTRQAPQVTPPPGRKLVFLGDLVDRGPDTPGVLYLAMHMLQAGTALWVPGNHDVKLQRQLAGRNVRLTHGLAESVAQLAQEPEAFRQQVADCIDRLVSHYVLDDGKLVVAHAGMKAAYQGRTSGRVREFALYGETTGEVDEFGLPQRYAWANDYRGSAMVVYGHTPVATPQWVNRTLCIDTGCVFGGQLTALRYPEKELVAVPARRMYYEPLKPLAAAPESAQSAPPREALLLDMEDVSGKRVIDTRHFRRITLREDNARAALEVMSRFAIDPRWLVYLPPTMAPPETAPEGPWLERPQEALAWFDRMGVHELVCEEKHMGSRAIIVLCQNAQVAQQRFGLSPDSEGMGQTPEQACGVIYTRTGRAFFNQRDTERAVLDRLHAALGRAGLWDELGGWVVLDAEIMPWSAKAQELLLRQYAPTGVAARAALHAATAALQAASAAGQQDTAELLAHTRQRLDDAQGFINAWRRYCWPVQGLKGLKIAPFHLLAHEGQVGLVREHAWHLALAERLAAADPALLQATRHVRVDTRDAASVAQAVQWWEQLTAAGGEGMVVKPASGLVSDARGLLQPAIKCRGREYLRIIYGPEYTAPAHLERLRQRGLRAKQSLALREYALGLEALHRFVEGEPLYRVHECVFGVLALESEPMDARL